MTSSSGPILASPGDQSSACQPPTTARTTLSGPSGCRVPRRSPLRTRPTSTPGHDGAHAHRPAGDAVSMSDRGRTTPFRPYQGTLRWVHAPRFRLHYPRSRAGDEQNHRIHSAGRANSRLRDGGVGRSRPMRRAWLRALDRHDAQTSVRDHRRRAHCRRSPDKLQGYE